MLGTILEPPKFTHVEPLKASIAAVVVRFTMVSTIFISFIELLFIYEKTLSHKEVIK